MISAVVAVLVLPWNLYSNPVVINYFLGGLGAILGPLFGIMITDYYFVRRGRVVIDDLFRDGTSGAYYYSRGINLTAVWVFVPTALVSCVIALWSPLAPVAPFALFIGGALAAVIYYFAMRNHPSLALAGEAGRREGAPARAGEPNPALVETESEDGRASTVPSSMRTRETGGTKGRAKQRRRREGMTRAAGLVARRPTKMTVSPSRSALCAGTPGSLPSLRRDV
jgi:hypothetical protein